jgi:hypothetical protein
VSTPVKAEWRRAGHWTRNEGTGGCSSSLPDHHFFTYKMKRSETFNILRSLSLSLLLQWFIIISLLKIDNLNVLSIEIL